MVLPEPLTVSESLEISMIMSDWLYDILAVSGYVSGASKDWAYGVKKIPYTGTLELRDYGEYGFFLPPNQIHEVCEEVTDGLIGLVKAAEVEDLFGRNSGNMSIASIFNILVISIIVKFISNWLSK